MRVAIIDLGTNSVRFDVHQFNPGPRLHPRLLHREKIMVRLGQGLFSSGHLERDAIRRTVHAFTMFRKVCVALGVDRTIAVGTSALREAGDGVRLVSRIRKSAGIDVRVISGSQEAHLIALGILGNEPVARKRVALIDIGGGSTEVTVAHHRRLLKSESLPLGTARLQQVFLKKSPPNPPDLEQLRSYIRTMLSTRFNLRNRARPQVAYGSSGTVRALAKIMRKTEGRKSLRIKEIEQLNRKMSRMTTTQLLGIAGMEAKRVDMILAGSVLLEECMRFLKIEKLQPTEYSLRDGILIEQLQLASQYMTSPMGLHLDDLYDKARGLGVDVRRTKSVVAISEQLFIKLRRIHKLDLQWAMYLAAAVVLRNVGESICMIGHQEHSFYIVKHAKFPFVEDWEAEFIAQLCLNHEKQKIGEVELPFANEKKKRDSFLKLLALLWVVDALDAEVESVARIKRVAVTNQAVRITYAGGTQSDLEMFRVEQRRSLFEAVFGRELIVKRGR